MTQSGQTDHRTVERATHGSDFRLTNLGMLAGCIFNGAMMQTYLLTVRRSTFHGAREAVDTHRCYQLIRRCHRGRHDSRRTLLGKVTYCLLTQALVQVVQSCRSKILIPRTRKGSPSCRERIDLSRSATATLRCGSERRLGVGFHKSTGDQIPQRTTHGRSRRVLRPSHIGHRAGAGLCQEIDEPPRGTPGHFHNHIVA